MHCHCGTNNRTPRWTFTDPCKPEVRPGAREESASPACLAASIKRDSYSDVYIILSRDLINNMDHMRISFIFLTEIVYGQFHGIELKFCIWLCFTVLQNKFECRQFALMFVGVMPLLELRILKIHSFGTFLLHALTYWAEILHMTLFHRTTDQVRLSSICVNFVGVMPLFELRILKIHSFPHFSLGFSIRNAHMVHIVN